MNDLHPTDTPGFAGRIPVSQAGGEVQLFAMLGFSMLAAAPFLAGAVWCMDDNATGWRAGLLVAGGLVLIVLAIVAMFAGFVGWMMVEAWWQRWRGHPEPFNQTTAVDIGAHGLSVEGLGHAGWRDVLAIEGVPDSDSHRIVHTRPFGKLLLQAPVDVLAPVFDCHLARPPTTDGNEPALRALVFHWPGFRAWIWAGYALAAGVAAAMLVGNPGAGAFKTLVALGLLTPLTAWLVWWIPFGQLGAFSAKRVRAFELDGSVLRCTDGHWTVDLRQRPATHHHVRGLGYEIEFLTLRPRKGGRFDLVLGTDPSHHALLATLDERALLSSHEHRPVID